MSVKLAKLKVTSHGPKVDHPLAKYNSKGDLYCLLCNTIIKNSNVWKVHLSSKNHKENLILFKSGKSPSNTLKRSIPPSDSIAPPRTVKKAKTDNDTLLAPPRSLKSGKLGAELTVNKTPEPVAPPSETMKTGILKASSKVTPSLPEGFVPKSRIVKPQVTSVEDVRVAEVNSNLPTGFFDDNVALAPVPNDDLSDDDEAAKDDVVDTKINNSAKNLPDGFFDDAREDAKARKIEYKDPQQVEWEKFQNEMEQEDIRYNTIIEEDDQKLRDERDVDIGIEQKLWDYRVESIASSAQTGEICIEDKKAFEVKLGLAKAEPDVKMEVDLKKEELDEDTPPPIEVKMEYESDSSDDEDELMDWRTKRGL